MTQAQTATVPPTSAPASQAYRTALEVIRPPHPPRGAAYPRPRPPPPPPPSPPPPRPSRGALEGIGAAEPRVADAIAAELTAQRESLKLIASENSASPAVLLTMGNWLSDKYAQGTVGRRFYAGCQNVDTVESVAAEHARALFGAP